MGPVKAGDVVQCNDCGYEYVQRSAKRVRCVRCGGDAVEKWRAG